MVLEEWRGRRGAGARYRDETLPLIYKGSQYAERNVIGTEESLRGFEPDALRRFYRDWYRPDLMALVVVGDFDVDEVEGKIESHFSGLTNPEKPRERPRYPIDDHEETLFLVFTDPELPQTAVTLMSKHDDPYDPTFGGYRAGLVEGLLHAILNERLRDIAAQADPSFLQAGVGTFRLTPTEGGESGQAMAMEGRALDALEALLIEVRRMQEFGVTEAELKRAQASQMRFYQGLYEERDKLHSRNKADEIYRNFTINESVPGIVKEHELASAFIPGITIEEVNQLASDLMRESSRVVTLMSPEKEGLAVPTEAELAEAIARAEAAPVEPLQSEAVDAPLMAEAPEPGSVVETREIPELGVTELTLSNGARVVLKPTDFKKDEVVFSAVSKGGYALVGDERVVPARSATAITRYSGIGAFNATDISKRLAGTDVSLTPYIGKHREGMNGNASPTDLETLFTLIHLAFIEPRFDEVGLERDRRSRTSSIENRLTNPDSVFRDKFNEVMYQGHPRWMPWTLATLDQLDLEASATFYGERFANAGDFTFLLVGAFTLEEIEPLISTYIASLPGSDERESPGDDGSRRVTGIQKAEVAKGIEQKSYYRLEFHGDIDYDPDTRSQLSGMKAVLSTLLREELREELGGVYGVSVSTGTWQDPETGYRLTVSFSCDPNRVEELRQATFEVLERFRSEPVDAHYVDQEKEKNRRSRETQLLENGFWLSQLTAAYRRGEDPMQILDFETRNERLNPAFIQEAAERFIDLDQYVQVILTPETSE